MTTPTGKALLLVVAVAAAAAGAAGQSPMAPALMLSPDEAGNAFGAVRDGGPDATQLWLADPSNPLGLPTHTPPLGTQARWAGYNPPMPGTDYDPMRAAKVERFPFLGTMTRRVVDGGAPPADLRDPYALSLLETGARQGPLQPQQQQQQQGGGGDVEVVYPPMYKFAPNGFAQPGGGYTSVYARASVNNPLNAGVVLPLPVASEFLRTSEAAQRVPMWMPASSNSGVGDPGAHLVQLQPFEFVELDEAARAAPPAAAVGRCVGCVHV